jgi:polysaccharide biosynthesis/export protein
MRVTAFLTVFVLSTGVGSIAQDAQDHLYATHGRYRLQPGDVVEVQYRHSAEFNQSVTVQPDGFVMLQMAGELRVAGLTVEEARLAVTKQSEVRLKDPEVALSLKEFEKPSFVVGGEVAKPGRFDLRGPTTALEAIAMAGGFTPDSKHSQVLLVRRLDEHRAQVTPLDMKKMEQHPQQAQEYPLRAGDMLIIPKNALSKVERIVKWASVGVFWNPFAK